jgi:diphthamide synthase (EF-2-diphthine--ammonia ligase)
MMAAVTTTCVLWSGGKDCFAAGLRSGALEAAGTRLVTFVPAGERAAFRCHPLGVMRRQAARLGLRHDLVGIDRGDWEASYRLAFARLASEGVERIVTGDITPQAWPWLGEATAAAGLALETPLALGVDDDPAVLLDFLAAAEVEATVAGLRAEHYRATFLGRPAGRALLREHGLDDPDAFHPCGERGEYHTVVTAFRGTRFVEEDPAGLAHVEHDGVWALDWAGGAGNYASDFH